MVQLAKSYLVGGLEHEIYLSIQLGIILPIDELHHVSRWLLHHQPVIVVDVGGKQAVLVFPSSVKVAMLWVIQHDPTNDFPTNLKAMAQPLSFGTRFGCLGLLGSSHSLLMFNSWPEISCIS